MLISTLILNLYLVIVYLLKWKAFSINNNELVLICISAK